MKGAHLLHWFPQEPAAWLARTSRLSPEAYTAYDRLRCLAWLATARGEPACSLPDDDEELANMSGLGRSWPKVSAKVRAMFKADGGRLLDEDLLATWYAQQAAYTKRSTAGGKGGKAKAMRKQSGSNATALFNQSELESEGAVERGPKGPSVLPAPASDDALALEGARDVDAEPAFADQDSWDDDVGIPGDEPITRSQLDQEGRALDLAYANGLRGAVSKWRDANRDEYDRHESAERILQGISPTKVLSDLGQGMLDEAVIERIRRALKWPTQDEWAEEKRRRGELPEIVGAA